MGRPVVNKNRSHGRSGWRVVLRRRSTTTVLLLGVLLSLVLLVRRNSWSVVSIPQTTTSVTRSRNNSLHQNNKGSNHNRNKNHNHKTKTICFVQSVFGDPTHPALDRPPNVTSLYPNNNKNIPNHNNNIPNNPNNNNNNHQLRYRFFYFTNLPDLITPGWTKILLPDSRMAPIQRHITISRKPKFLAWKIEPKIQTECTVVMYMDGQFSPRPNRQAKLERLATSVIESTHGLLQVTHPKGGTLTKEFARIVSGTKDTQAHVDASLAWLTTQPDWNNEATLYWNAFFVYDPTNPIYQQASEFFWERYSQELDSWRDQPLWAYTLHHFGIQPLTIRHDTLHSTVYEDFSLKGDHHYADEHSITVVKSRARE